MNVIEDTKEIIDEMEQEQIDYIVEHPEEFETEILEEAKKRVLDKIIEKAKEELKAEQENLEKNEEIEEVTPERIEQIANEQTKISGIKVETDVIREQILNEKEQSKEDEEIGEK